MKQKLLIIVVALLTFLLVGGVLISYEVTSVKVYDSLNLGNKYLKEGKYEEAIIAFEKVIKIEPKNIEARVGLAKTYIATGKFDEAEKILKEVIGIDPKKAEPYIELAKLYISENNPLWAINILTDGYKAAKDESLKSMLEDLKSKITVEDIDKTVILGENYSLQKEVSVKIDNVNVQVAVKWDRTTVDTTKVGVTVFTGVLEITDKTLRLTLNVIGIASIENINSAINQNDKYSLPSKVTAKMTDGSTHDVEITWNPTNVDTSKIGNYSYEGTVNGYNGKVMMNLKVEKPYIKGEELQVYNNLLNDKNWLNKNGIVFGFGLSKDDHYIVDLNQDGVYEMLIYHGTCEADLTLSVVTYNNGNIKIQHLPCDHGGYEGYSKSTKVFFLTGLTQGYFDAVGYELKNGVCSEVFECSNDEGRFDDPKDVTYTVNGKKVSKAEYESAWAAFGKIE